jgi:hypothetical protein
MLFSLLVPHLDWLAAWLSEKICFMVACLEVVIVGQRLLSGHVLFRADAMLSATSDRAPIHGGVSRPINGEAADAFSAPTLALDTLLLLRSTAGLSSVEAAAVTTKS